MATFPVNPVTDSLGLVSYSPVVGGNWLFPANVGNDEGFDLHVFTATGQYRGMANGQIDHVRARDGDLVVRVNRGLHTFTFGRAEEQGLPTNDGYPRGYEVVVQLKVAAPTRAFAVACRQQSDPARVLQDTVDGALRRWSVQLKHDEISPEAMRFRARTSAQLAQAETCLEVMEVLSAAAYSNSHFVKLAQLQREAEIAAAERENKAESTQWERVEKRKDGDLARDEALLNADTASFIKGRQTLLDDDLARYRELRDQGLADEDIANQNPDLFEVARQLRAPRALPQLGAGSTIGAPNVGTAPSAGVVDEQSRAYYDVHFGVHIAQTGLSQAQSDELDRYTLAVRLVFEIRRLDESGPAARAGLLLGDVIVQIEKQPLIDEQSVPTLALGAPKDQPAHIYFLRKEQLFQLNVLIDR